MTGKENLEVADLAEVTSASAVTMRLLPDGRMDPESAAAYLGVSSKTLANYRSRGIGPRFIKRGRIFYRRSDLDSWLADGECQSTAQARLKVAGSGQGSL